MNHCQCGPLNCSHLLFKFKVMSYIQLRLSKTFGQHCLRVKFEPSQGTTMIDVSTIYSLELVQNLRNTKSKDSLLGMLNQTLTPMGSRFLKSNILQPSTDTDKLEGRYESLSELTSKEYMFHSIRDGKSII